MKYTFEIADNQFENRLLEIKGIYDAEVDYSIFWQIVQNLKNYTTRTNRYNSLSIEEWVALYSKSRISVTENQLQLVFEYLRKHYSGILRRVDEKTYSENLTSNISGDENPFGLEMVVLKSISITA